MDEAVKLLLSLKAEYKEKTGQDYKPGQPPSSQTSDLNHPKSTETSSPDSPEAQVIFNQVALQGEEVRKLKLEKAEKVIILINSFIYLEVSLEYILHSFLFFAAILFFENKLISH